MITKNSVLTTLEEMPERFSVDEFLDRLIFLNKIEEGLEDSRKGRVYTTTEARRKLKKWLK
jgi:predicted transcriptional regulator